MRALIDSVKQLDFSNKDITNQINQVNNRYDELVADANGEKHLTRIKKALIKLKNYIKDTLLMKAMYRILYSPAARCVQESTISMMMP